MKPICVPCRRFFRMKRSGFYFTEAMPADGEKRPQAGTVEPAKWKPYKIWSGDRWECPGCGATIVVGTGMAPVSEHYEPDFGHYMRTLHADQLQVNDC